jgi:Bacterial sugar transferase
MLHGFCSWQENRLISANKIFFGETHAMVASPVKSAGRLEAMTEKTMLRRTATIRTKDSGPGRASSATFPGMQTRTDVGNFQLNPARLPNVPVQFAIKRVVDAVSAFVGLVILTPVLLFIAILIKLDSKGPVFAQQLHLGLNGAPFELLTFRCIRTDSGFSSPHQPNVNDPHLTRLGRLLKGSKFDLLPRLWTCSSATCHWSGLIPTFRTCWLRAQLQRPRAGI